MTILIFLNSHLFLKYKNQDATKYIDLILKKSDMYQNTSIVKLMIHKGLLLINIDTLTTQLVFFLHHHCFNHR